MPNSTVRRRAIILNVAGNNTTDQSIDDALLQLAAMVGAVRDIYASLLADATGETEDVIFQSIDSLFDRYYQSFLEQLNHNN